MNESLVPGSTRHKVDRAGVRAGLVAAAALGAAVLMVSPVAQAATERPGTCTHTSDSWSYVDKKAMTIKIKVTMRNYGDLDSRCRVIIHWGPDGSCVTIPGSTSKTVTLLRSAVSSYEKVAKC